jgi:hypothetical protein
MVCLEKHINLAAFACCMETKQQVTKKFILGVVLIVLSLAIGKLVLLPIIFFPGDNTWRITMIWIYAFSWMILFIGFYFAGKEGYRLVTKKYHEIQNTTIHHVKRGGAKAAGAVAKTGAMAAKGTVHVIKTGASIPGHVKRQAAKIPAHMKKHAAETAHTIKESMPHKDDLTFMSQK